jgi:hypothetical protein
MAPMEQRWTLGVDKLWSTQLKDPINCLTIGKPFIEDLSEENDILVGTTSGRVLTLNQTKVSKHCFLLLSLFFNKAHLLIVIFYIYLASSRTS